MNLLRELNEGKEKWPVSDEEIIRFWSSYEPDANMIVKRLAAEEWRDKFLEQQISSGEYDKFINYAIKMYDKVWDK